MGVICLIDRFPSHHLRWQSSLLFFFFSFAARRLHIFLLLQTFYLLFLLYNFCSSHGMRFTTAFVALLALTPVLCAPVPTPEAETVDSLARSANGDSAVLIKKLTPIAQEIVTLLGTMLPVQAADKAPAGPAPAGPSPVAPAPAGPASQPDVKDPAAPGGGDASPPAAQPETPNGAPNAEPATPTTPASDGAGAETPATAAPTDAPNDTTVQRRAVDPPAAESPATPTSTSAPAPSAPAPSAPSTEIKPNDVYKLRTLLARATMYEQAIEQVLLAKGKNIEDRPTSKTAGGVAWGIANGPIMAILGASGMIQKQPS